MQPPHELGAASAARLEEQQTHAPPPRELWRHSCPEKTSLYEFKRKIEEKYDVLLPSYRDLHKWSINNLAFFWAEVWDYTGIRSSQSYSNVLDEDAPMFPPPPFFAGARLNFAENLLYPKYPIDEDSIAIVAATEESREEVTWKQLRERVAQCAAVMRSVGIRPGDRVAGCLANHTNAVVAMLGATAVGAIWTGVSPDTGVHAILERLRQIKPAILFADNAVIYNGKVHDVLDKVQRVVEELPNLTTAVIIKTVSSHPIDLERVKPVSSNGKAYTLDDFLASASEKGEDKTPHFEQLDPNHPVYILYSSGTTGQPKCIVHGAIGTIIQHKKEHAIHCDIKPGDKLFYFTTCTWMMWHWLISALGSGATIVLYDGSPFRPLDKQGSGEMAMPRLIEELGITHFGTSAKYLSMLEQKQILPKAAQVPMRQLRAIYSTGSPLAPSTFEYVYRAFGPDINLGSITGGTDIISLFGAPSSLNPVYAGEIQVIGLGMAVEAWDYQGQNVSQTGEPGDLVCTRPFPCQPVQFWGPQGADLYRRSYFEHFSGLARAGKEDWPIWHHGDFIRIDPATGGLIMLGRSDGILKPAGVRFGSAELYNLVLQHFPLQVADALCIGRRRETDTDETVVMFLKMVDGQTFSRDLEKQIKDVIRRELSARHVPAVVDECEEIPVTTNGKKVEVAVKQILCGMNVKTSASVANAECLDWYRQWTADHP
ncbi:acetoacetate-CoA ligase [Xylona heveae TC161]|uniref:Acetoacetate-CoA ligase n=1 Tax=Xylona heveae (strain CBS 132557 / TC161) TaxID=1328760 RepID=A0A165JTH1_XYLHT|nr:acetoacetate-CoA ligase [Xylona heveae TC161]KZF26604.1 acetoacetate-CoA ligase [Xylona heveae TC161]